MTLFQRLSQIRVSGLIALFILMIVFPCKSQEKTATDEWPQWMGPDRSGIWHLDLKKESLESGDLRKIWEVPVGTGYSGPTVSGGRVYLMDYVGESVK